MEVIRAVDTVVVATLDRISRNFEEGVRIQADLTRGDIGIVSNRENIDTWEGARRPSSFGGPRWPRRAYQVDSASERIKLGLEHAMAEGKRVDRPQTLSSEQLEQCRLMGGGGRRVEAGNPGAGLLAGYDEEGAGFGSFEMGGRFEPSSEKRAQSTSATLGWSPPEAIKEDPRTIVVDCAPNIGDRVFR